MGKSQIKSQCQITNRFRKRFKSLCQITNHESFFPEIKSNHKSHVNFKMKFKSTQSCDAVITWAFFGTKSRNRLEKTLRNELVCVEWDVKA